MTNFGTGLLEKDVPPNTRAAARALADALALFPAAREVTLLTVGGEKTISSSIAEKTTTDVLPRKGLIVDLVRRERETRSIGTALQQEARALKADLLVMGAYGHSRLRDFILGGATLAAIDDPQIPILMSH